MFDRHAFWRDPRNSGRSEHEYRHCVPEFYLDLENVTQLIVSTIQRYATPEMSILELGCGTGRNLVGLYRAGFHKLSGVEINQSAVDLGQSYFPEYVNIPVTVSPLEEVIETIPNVDVIFTQGCLMHLPVWITDWVIPIITQKAQHLIIFNEGERDASFHAWPHDYKFMIESGGRWKQVETHTDELWPPLIETTVKRVFIKNS